MCEEREREREICNEIKEKENNWCLNAITHRTLLGSKCRSKENRRHKNSSSHSEKQILGMNEHSSVLSSSVAICNSRQMSRTVLHKLCTYQLYLIYTLVLTLENMEPINCMVAKVLGGSLASIPSNALDNEIDRRSMNTSAPARSSDFAEVDKDVRNSDRPANATDVTAVFNW